MNTLEEIVDYKRKEVEERKGMYPVRLLESSIFFNSPTVSLRKYILREDKFGIIAEIKRKSPSRGIINRHISIERTSIGYMQAGASALSILTDEKYFGGSNEDLKMARKFNFCPILRKDFIIDEYQITEARSIGADAILLIAAVLDPKELEKLAGFAKALDLEVVMEVHDKDELLKNLHQEIDIIGVNNRNLKTLEVNLNTSLELAAYIPEHYLRISESGINNPESIVKLKKSGFNGFLIGEYFMMHSLPEQACDEFIRHLKKLTDGSI